MVKCKWEDKELSSIVDLDLGLQQASMLFSCIWCTGSGLWTQQMNKGIASEHRASKWVSILNILMSTGYPGGKRCWVHLEKMLVHVKKNLLDLVAIERHFTHFSKQENKAGNFCSLFSMRSEVIREDFWSSCCFSAPRHKEWKLTHPLAQRWTWTQTHQLHKPFQGIHKISEDSAPDKEFPAFRFFLYTM